MLAVPLQIYYNVYMKKLILYTNAKSCKSIWIYGDLIYESFDDETDEMMSLMHRLVRDQPENTLEFVESVKFLMKTYGKTG